MIIFNFIFVTLRFSLGFSLAGYSVYTARLNFVMDVLGGYLKDVKKSIKCLRLGPEADAQGNVIMHFEDCRNFETLHRTISNLRKDRD